MSDDYCKKCSGWGLIEKRGPQASTGTVARCPAPGCEGIATLKKMQNEVVANRKRRGFASATDLSKTTCGLAEEVGEFEQARKTEDREKMLDALADISVFCLGAFEILGADAQNEIGQVILQNAERQGQTRH